jgi:hypothetical protein
VLQRADLAVDLFERCHGAAALALFNALRTANIAARNAKERAEAEELRNQLTAIRAIRTRVR